MPKHEKIRLISATANGNRFAVSEFEKNVQVWDLEKGLINKIETDLAIGTDSPISISENGKHLAVAGYEKNTVVFYNISSATSLPT